MGKEKADAPRREVTEHEVQWHIAQACELVERNRRSGMGTFHLDKIEVDGQIMFRFIIPGDDTGRMDCVYDPAPLVAERLSRTELGSKESRDEAVFGLLAMLQSLAGAIALGLQNAYDASLVNHRINFAASDSIEKKGTRPRRFPQEEINHLRRDILKRMDARNRILCEAPHRGRTREVTEDRLAAAVGWLRLEGAEITPQQLALRCNCTQQAVSQQLKRQGETLEEFLARCS